MNIERLIVKEYLSSLTEEAELNFIFPILLTSMGFEILSKPAENKGLQEYGKDVVAVGKDEDGEKKRFYFEIKGGGDRNITNKTLHKADGIIESLREAKFVKFETSYKGFESLKKKVVLVHNGVISGSSQRIFEGFIREEFPSEGKEEFGRYGIEELTTLFSEKLFGAYLLTDAQNTKLFNRVLINLNASNRVSSDFVELVENLLTKHEWEGYKRSLPRKWIMLFQSMRLISFVVYSESLREYNNLAIAKEYLTYLIIRLWRWILENKLENDSKLIKQFDRVFLFYYWVLEKYFERTWPIASLQNGLYCEISGRYEQVGFTKRTLEYLDFLVFMLTTEKARNENFRKQALDIVFTVIRNNSVSARPLIDINSIPIMGVLTLLISFKEFESAKGYLREVLGYIINAKQKNGRFPDANNSYENVIRLVAKGEKSIYYIDSTSLLLGALLEYVVILGLEEEFEIVRDFALENEIDLGLFFPYHGNQKYLELVQNKEMDLEEQLFSNPSFNEGYQWCISLRDVSTNKKIGFEQFKAGYMERKAAFSYDYRTDKAGYHYLRDLAHSYYRIPFFPDKWNSLPIVGKPTNINN